MKKIDSGCNLTDDSFDHDRDAVIEAARTQGVVQIIVTGASEDGSLKALQLAKKRPGSLYATAGIHPHRAVQLTSETLSVLAELHRHEYVVAVGECGLDYHRDLSPRSVQRKAFEKQLELAVDCGKPVFLHQRESHDAFVAILRDFRPPLSAAVMHCFTYSSAALRDLLA